MLNNSSKVQLNLDFLNLGIPWYIYPVAIIPVISAFTILFNGAIIYSVFKSSVLRKNTCKILYALAITDILYGIIAFLIIPEALHTDMNEILFFEVRRICKALLLLVSTNIVALVSVNRYIEMTCVSSRQIQRKAMTCIIVGCWLFPLLTVLIAGVIKYKQSIKMLLGAQNLFAICIMMTSYLLILKTLRQTTRSVKEFSILSQAYASNEKHASKTILLIVTCFILLQSPLALSLIVELETTNSLEMQMWKLVGFTLSLINSMLNPIIYSYRTQSIKTVLLKTFHRETPTTTKPALRLDNSPDNLFQRCLVGRNVFVMRATHPAS